jgi:hypothetical protein
VALLPLQSLFCTRRCTLRWVDGRVFRPVWWLCTPGSVPLVVLAGLSAAVDQTTSGMLPPELLFALQVRQTRAQGVGVQRSAWRLRHVWALNEFQRAAGGPRVAGADARALAR